MNNHIYYGNGKSTKRMKTTRPSGAVRFWECSGKTVWETEGANGSQIGSKFDVSSIFGKKYADYDLDDFRKGHEIKNSALPKLATVKKSAARVDDSRLDKLEKSMGDISDALAILLKNQAK